MELANDRGSRNIAPKRGQRGQVGTTVVTGETNWADVLLVYDAYSHWLIHPWQRSTEFWSSRNCKAHRRARCTEGISF